MYCLYETKNNTGTEKYLMTEECYQTVREALDKTRTMREIIERFEFFHDALLELEVWCRNVNQCDEYLMRNFHKAERLCRAVLFEFKSYIDHLQTTLAREYGKDSEILDIFRKGTNNAYDNCPEYAFVYQLRNSMQHFNKIVHSFVAPKWQPYLQPCSTPKILLEDNGWKEQELAFIREAKGNIDLQLAFEATYNAMENIQVPVMEFFLKLDDGAANIKMLKDWMDKVFTREESRYYHLAEVDEAKNVVALPVYWEAIYKIEDAMTEKLQASDEGDK